jgi:hypothetical protein
VFVPSEPSKPSLMLEGKAGAYLSEAPFMCSTLGKTPGITQNIKIGWKSLLVTKSLVYYENSYITAGKSFTTLHPGSQNCLRP